MLRHHGLWELAIDGPVATRSTLLPPIHADPCDRFILATAQVHGLMILTPDAKIRVYPRTDVL